MSKNIISTIQSDEQYIDFMYDLESSNQCEDDCVLGDRAHCGRTPHERTRHCEKRFYNKEPQLINMAIKGN